MGENTFGLAPLTKLIDYLSSLCVLLRADDSGTGVGLTNIAK